MYDSMVFYRSFFDAVEDCDDETTAAIFRALCMYGLYGEEIPLEGEAARLFRLMKPQIDANNRRKEAGRKNGPKGAEYGILGKSFGVLGGRPKNPDKTPAKPPLM